MEVSAGTHVDSSGAASISRLRRGKLERQRASSDENISATDIADMKEQIHSMETNIHFLKQRIQSYESYDVDGRPQNDARTGLGTSKYSLVPDDENAKVIFKDVLEQDTFALMMTSPFISKGYLFGVVVFAFQFFLVMLMILGLENKKVPFKIKWEVTAGQFFAIILSYFTQRDILHATETLILFHQKDMPSGSLKEEPNWYCILDKKEKESLKARRTSVSVVWFRRVVFPNVLKILEGILVLVSSVMVIIQAERLIDLLKDFAALAFASEFDNILFIVASQGYFGKYMVERTKVVENSKMPIVGKEDDDDVDSILTNEYSSVGTVLRTLFLVMPFIVILALWAYMVYGQYTGRLFRSRSEYKQCDIKRHTDFRKINDGKCNGGYLNTIDCKFDGGDCFNFNVAYAGCKVEDAFRIGNGICDKEDRPDFFTTECLFDGGDCCRVELKKNDLPINLIRDGFCNGGMYRSLCDHDGGDCDSCYLPKPGKTAYAIAVKDVNNDTYPDIVFGNYGGHNELVLNNGDGTYQHPQILPGGLSFTWSLSIGDIDDDGWNDIAIGNSGEPNILLMNEGNGIFSKVIILPDGGPVPRKANSIVLFDVNNDSFPDILVGNYLGEDSTNQLFLNDGQGNFTDEDAIDLPTSGARSIVVDDINGDGFPDIVFGSFETRNMVMFGLAEPGKFHDPVEIPGGDTSTFVIAVGDVNGDGFKDIIVGNSRDDESNQLILYKDNRTFEEPIVLPGGYTTTYSIIAADMNHDGRVDIVVGNGRDSGSVLINSGNVTNPGELFTELVDLPCSDDVPSAEIAAVDMNNDGVLDLVIGNDGRENQILINLGDGVSFREPDPDVLGSSWVPQ